MNQTKKRLSIIHLAISITDMDTIQLQVLKLALLKSDKKIVEILAALTEQNYAQAQRQITEYIDAPNEEVVQRSTQEEVVVAVTQKEQDQATIEEFDLFTTQAQETSTNFQEDINYDAFLEVDTQKENVLAEPVNFDTLLNVDAEDVLPNNIDLNLSQKTTEPLTEENTHIESDINTSVEEEYSLSQDDHEEPLFSSNHEEYSEPKENPIRENYDEDTYTSYNAIPHINTKFNHLYNQYPPIEYTEKCYFSIENWLLQIASDGYTEAEVEGHLTDAENIKETNLSESAQLLIAAASTESTYASFRLARALYAGDILQKNIPEAVTIMQYLAVNDEYPEAICDLAQFHEQGIEVEHNKKKAEALYKEAMDLGIQRAIKHHERLQEENKSFFSRFQK